MKKNKNSHISSFSYSHIRTLLQGSVMGIAEILPGVSGSTFALIMGIYDDFINLLHSVSDVVKEILKFILGKSSKDLINKKIKDIDFVFGGLLVFGMLLSIGILSNIIEELLHDYPQEVSAFFFGLVLASVSIPWKEMKIRGSKQIAIATLIFVTTFILLGLKPATYSETPPELLFFFGGIVGVSGLILPGISGSFILLLLGLYEHVISIVKGLTRFEVTPTEVTSLGLFLTGLAFGFIGFVRILKIGLEKYPNELMAALIGLMLGSLRVLWPFFEVYEDVDGHEARSYLEVSTFSSNEILTYVVIAALAFMAIVLVNNSRKIDQKEFEKIK